VAGALLTPPAVGCATPLQAVEPSIVRCPRPSTGIPSGESQGWDMAVVDVVQLGISGLLPGPDRNDMRRCGDSTEHPAFGIGAGACDGPLFISSRIPTPWAGRVKVGITVTPDAHAHFYLSPSMASSVMGAAFFTLSGHSHYRQIPRGPRLHRAGCSGCPPIPVSPRRLVERPHQLIVNLIEVDADHAAGPPHAVTRKFAIGYKPTHGSIADLKVLSGFGDRDVPASHHGVQVLNRPSCNSDSRSIRIFRDVPMRRASSCSWAMILRIRVGLTW
ncbi:Mycobacterium rhizamassiliense ORFan, partial [Mycobacterium rhizamassiliense]